MAARALGDIERLDHWLDLSLNLSKEFLHLLWIGAGEFVLDDEPSDRIQVDTRDLKTQARTFDQGGATAHEAVEHLEMLEVLRFLMVGVVHIPDGLGRLPFHPERGCPPASKDRSTILILFGWGLHGGGNQHGAKDTAAATSPPFAHLIDGLALHYLQAGKGH